MMSELLTKKALCAILTYSWMPVCAGMTLKKKHMALETVLQDIGLSPKEAAVYLAALELGQAAVLRVAQKAGVKRPTAYVTLTALQEKGLIEIIPKGTTTLYQAADPAKILADFEERARVFRDVLPEFRSLANAAPGKPRVRFYEGKKAILGLYEKEIFAGGEIIGVVSMKDVRSMISRDEQMGLIHTMKANGIHIRDLIEDSPEAQEYLQEKNRLGLGETKFLPRDLQFAVDILVYENTVAMISPKNTIAVLIEDRAIADAQRQFLEFLWRSIH